MKVIVASIIPHEVTDPVTFHIFHPNEARAVQIIRDIDPMQNNWTEPVVKYIQSTWNIGWFHGEVEVYCSGRGDGVNLIVSEFDFDEPSPATVKPDVTTRSYAVANTPTDLMLAMSILDKQPYSTDFKLLTCDCTQEHSEWHLTVTGLAKLHSDLLEHFEWLGK